jgi:hypothetical protein
MSSTVPSTFTFIFHNKIICMSYVWSHLLTKTCLYGIWIKIKKYKRIMPPIVSVSELAIAYSIYQVEVQIIGRMKDC